MNKPTDEELEKLRMRAYNAHIEGARAAANRVLHDAGIAHGWREAIEALRARTGGEDASDEFWSGLFWREAAEHLERLAKERGHL